MALQYTFFVDKYLTRGLGGSSKPLGFLTGKYTVCTCLGKQKQLSPTCKGSKTGGLRDFESHVKKPIELTRARASIMISIGQKKKISVNQDLSYAS